MNQQVNKTAITYDAILKQAVKEKRGVYKFSKTYPAYIVLLFFIIISFFVRNFFQNQVKSENQTNFDKATTSVMSRFEGKHQINLQILRSITGVYDNLEQVVRDFFDLYSSIPIKTYPSLLSTMYIQRVKEKELGDFNFYAQRSVWIDYKVYPTDEKKSEYLPILFVIPQQKNQHILGFDVSTKPMLKEAIYKARDNNEVVATPNFINREPDTSVIFLMAPVYKKDSARNTLEERQKNFEGIVILEIIPKLFFQEALGEGIASDTTIIFECIDLSADKEHQKIFNTANFDLLQTGYTPDFISEKVLKIADKDILVKFYSIPSFVPPFQKILPNIAFGISLVISFAFFGFILSVTTSRARAVDLAERMTRSQRRIVDSSKDIIAVLDMKGTWKSMNPASLELLGYEPAELIDEKIDNLFVEPKDLLAFYNALETTTDEFTYRMDYQMKTKNGELKWINWNFTISAVDNLVYCIGRDVTLEKLAEEQARLRAKQIQLAEQFTKESSEFKSLFMIKLSHQLRNNLTGINGYLQLVSNKLYENEEELESYIQFAEESSEDLFAFISDIDEVTASTGELAKRDLRTISFDKIFNELVEDFQKNLDKETKVNIVPMDGQISGKVLADANLLKTALLETFTALIQGTDNIEIQVGAIENPYEGATEIQIVTTANPLVTEMINIYKQNTNNLIEALKFDKNDVIFHLAIAGSNIRMMGGSWTLDTFGPEEGNVIQITMPLTKITE